MADVGYFDSVSANLKTGAVSYTHLQPDFCIQIHALSADRTGTQKRDRTTTGTDRARNETESIKRCIRDRLRTYDHTGRILTLDSTTGASLRYTRNGYGEGTQLQAEIINNYVVIRPAPPALPQTQPKERTLTGQVTDDKGEPFHNLQ